MAAATQRYNDLVINGTITATNKFVATPVAAPSALQGAIWLDSTQQSVATWLGSSTANSIVGYTSTALFAATTPVTSVITGGFNDSFNSGFSADVSVTSSLVGTGVGTKALPASFFAVGKVVKIKANGYITTTNQPSTLVFSVLFGSTIIANTNAGAALAPAANLTSAPWSMECMIICTAIGSSGALLATGNILMSTLTSPSFSNAGMANVGLFNTGTPTAVMVDTTITGIIDFQITNSTTGSTVVCSNFTMETIL